MARDDTEPTTQRPPPSRTMNKEGIGENNHDDGCSREKTRDPSTSSLSSSEGVTSNLSLEESNGQQEMPHEQQKQQHSDHQSEVMETARATLKRNHSRAQREAAEQDAAATANEESNSNNSSSSSNDHHQHNHQTSPLHRSNHVVTTTATTNTTTSSGDDRDSSGNNSGDTPSDHPEHHQQQHHHQHHSQQQFLNRRHLQQHDDEQQRSSLSGSGFGSSSSLLFDGSSLQLPVVGAHESNEHHQLLARGHAAVIASSRLLHHTDSSAATSLASGGEAENLNQQQQQGAAGSIALETGSASSSSLLEPHREPGYHTIKRTFHQFSKKQQQQRSKPKSKASSSGTTSGASSSNDDEEQHTNTHHLKAASSSKKRPALATKKRASDKSRLQVATERPTNNSSPEPESDQSKDRGEGAEGGGSSSGSGTEGGYAGSAELGPQSSSPSVSSSEGSQRKMKSKRRRKNKDGQDHDDSGGNSTSSSSEIADFSSGTASPSISSSNSDDIENDNEHERNDLEQAYLRAKRSSFIDQDQMLQAVTKKRRYSSVSEPQKSLAVPTAYVNTTSTATVEDSSGDLKPAARTLRAAKIDPTALLDGKPPIIALGSDVMAHVLTFLEPPEILTVLTSPLSKDWNKNFTSQPELWRVLCLVDPFKASVDGDNTEEGNSSESEDSFCSLGDSSGESQEQGEKRALARYRLLYTSFVRCMRYLSQIKDDAINGRPPSFIDYGMAGGGIARTQHSSPKRAPSIVGASKSLQSFLSQARGAMLHSNGMDLSSDSSLSSSDQEQKVVENDSKGVIGSNIGDEKRKRKHFKDSKKTSKKPKLGYSMITGRLLGPAMDGQAGNLTLPWSCAIYSIVNWMVAFSDVEGIQTLCLKVLPFLLEDEQQRMTAQRAGLTDVVLRAMVMFPDSAQLHTAAFHTIVLLARPLGGREGMLFHSSMINASGIFGTEDSKNGKSGIAVMLDSIRRFEANVDLAAMSCWSLVNIALAPVQKVALVKLGGIQATSNAMKRHPYSAEVQFRALFALINLVIPSVRLNAGANNNGDEDAVQEQLGEVNDTTEKEILDEVVGDVTELVVNAMKNFCSSEAILNRACLVLHNLSLTQDYHSTLLFTPNCYQMLEWCLSNYRTDQVLQQSATGTLHRLQITLANDRELGLRFAEHLRTQQQLSLEQAHREAIHLSEQQAALHNSNR